MPNEEYLEGQYGDYFFIAGEPFYNPNLEEQQYTYNTEEEITYRAKRNLVEEDYVEEALEKERKNAEEYEEAREDEALLKYFRELTYVEELRAGIEHNDDYSERDEYLKWLENNAATVSEMREDFVWHENKFLTQAAIEVAVKYPDAERSEDEYTWREFYNLNLGDREDYERYLLHMDKIELLGEEEWRNDVDKFIDEISYTTLTDVNENEAIDILTDLNLLDQMNTFYAVDLVADEILYRRAQEEDERRGKEEPVYIDELHKVLAQNEEKELMSREDADEKVYYSYFEKEEEQISYPVAEIPSLYAELNRSIEEAKKKKEEVLEELDERLDEVSKWEPEYSVPITKSIRKEIEYIEEKGYSYKDPDIRGAWEDINNAQSDQYENIENERSMMLDTYTLMDYYKELETEIEEEKTEVNYLDAAITLATFSIAPDLSKIPNLIGVNKAISDELWLYVSGDGWKEDIISVATTVEGYYDSLMRKIAWYKKQASHVPEQLRWIPVIINMLDDAQDILITALYLARPLLRKLITKPIPVVGWALTANDLLNLSTMALGSAMTPGLRKTDVLFMESLNKLKLKNPQKYAEYIKMKGGFRSRLSFVIQGLQASDTLTGYGLQLGGIMGALSDVTWATLGFMWNTIKPYGITEEEGRLYQMKESYAEAVAASQKLIDQTVRSGSMLWDDLRALTGLRSPEGWEYETAEYEGLDPFFGEERSEKEFKAERMLLQFPQLPNFAHWLHDEDLIKIIAAQRVATGIFYDMPVSLNDRRADIITMLPFPTAKPVNPESRQALKDSGIDIANAIPAVKVPQNYPTVGHVIDAAFEQQESFERTLRAKADQNPKLWSIVYRLWREAGLEVLEKTLGLTEEKDLGFPSYILVPAMLADYNLQLVPPYTDDDLRVWWLGAQREADVSGRDYPHRPDWINSALKNGLKWQNKN